MTNPFIVNEARYNAKGITVVPGAGTFPYISDTLLVPGPMSNLSVTVASMVGTSASGSIQFSVSSIGDIINGSAEWLNWTAGPVTPSTAPITQSLGQTPINGVRFYLTAGTAGSTTVIWEVLGDKDEPVPISPVWLSKLANPVNLLNPFISGGAGVINGHVI